MIWAILASLAWVWVAQTMVRVALRIGLLPARCHPTLPSLSVVIAACNEQETIVDALHSLLNVDYPDLQIVLVNDRSGDATGDLMESVGAQDARVMVVHLDQLPQGWLGKSHALHLGAARATGQWLLFSDADVHFEPDSLARAVSFACDQELDHLIAGPRIQCDTFWEKIFVGFFGTAFCYRYRPDLVGDSNQYYVGVGAFNLVRTQVYRDLGGHSTLAMQVLDDMELGRLLKTRGFRQRFVGAGPAVSVRWCVGWNGLVHGLEKNAYAGLHYSPLFALASCAVVLWACLAPLWLLWHGAWAWGLLGLLAMQVCALCLWPSGSPPWVGLLFPLAGLLFTFILLRAGWLCHRRQGIRWRGTFYALDELRRAAPNS
ncbi:glycosyltransferase [bacterium]|nr:glycosyltransferase [bacterium]